MTEIVRVGIQIDTGQMVTAGPAAVRTLQSIRSEVEKLPPHLRAATSSVKTFSGTTSGLSPTIQNIGLSVKKKGEAVDKAAQQWEKLRNPLQNVALALSGIQGPMGKVIETLGMFAVGGGVTLAITAGLGLIIAAFNSLGEKARQEKARVAELNKTLAEALRVRQAEQNPFKDLTKTVGDLEKRVLPLRAQLAELNQIIAAGGRATGSASGNDRYGLAQAVIRAKELRALIFEIGQAQTEATFRAQTQAAENFDAEARKAAAEERRRQVLELGTLERRNALEAAQQARDIRGEITAIAAIRKADLDETLRANKRLTEAERERLTLATAIANRLADQKTTMDAIAQAASRVNLDTLGGIDAQLAEDQRKRDEARRKAILKAEGLAPPSLSDSVNAANAAARRAREDEETAKRLAEAKATAERIREVFTGAFEGIFARGLSGFKDLWDRVKEMGLAAAAGIAAAFAIKKLGLDGLQRGDLGSLTGKLSGVAKAVPVLIVGVAAGAAAGSFTSNKGLGALAGAASGAASGAAIGSAIPGIGTVAGAIVGGLAGAIGGIFGSGKKRKEEEAARQAARDQIAAFVAGLQDRTPLEQALAGLNEQYRAAAKAARDAGLSTKELAGLTAAYEKAQRKLREEFAQQTALFLENLEARRLEATGQSEAAAALRLRLQQEAELRSAEKEGYDQVTLARLRDVQALEAEAVAQKRAQEAAEARRAVLEDLTAREFKLAGNNQAAEAFRLQTEAARARGQARKDLAAGTIDTSVFDRLIAVIDGELADSLAALTARYAEQAAAAERANRTFAEDLEVRRLAALGQDKAAEKLRRELADARELEQARADGISEANLAQLAMIQGMEREADARRELEEQIAAQIAALRAEADFREDIRIRSLRARGFDQAADDMALLARHAKEFQDAVDAGRTQADLDALRQVQAEERARRDAERRDDQARAFAAAQPSTSTAPSAGSSATSINLAVGVSETTANRLAGLSSSMLIVMSQHLPEMQRLRRIEQALVVIAGLTARQTGSGVDVDALLGRTVDEADQALGKIATN